MYGPRSTSSAVVTRSTKRGSPTAQYFERLTPIFLADFSPSELFRVPIGKGIKCGNTVSLGPEANHARFGKCGIIDLKQRLAVEYDLEACAKKLHAKHVPLIGGHSLLYAISTPASDDIE